jgi:hypothetical protein
VRADNRLARLAAMVGDRRAINWDRVEIAAHDSVELDCIRQLRILSTLAGERVAAPEATAAERGLLAAADLLLTVAGAKVLVAIVAAGIAWDALSGGPRQWWAYISAVLVFGGSAAVLLAGGRRDQRSVWLGALFLLDASAFADGLLLPLAWSSSTVFARLASILRDLPVDAFLVTAFWLFVWTFPRPATTRAASRATLVGVVASAVAGTLLFAANLVLRVAAGEPVPRLLELVDRRAPGDAYYWPILFLLACPAFPCLVAKVRSAPAQERRRVAFFVGSLMVGTVPILLAALASPFVPYFDDAAHRRWPGVYLYALFLATAPLTAYSVLVHRVVDVRLVLRKTLQHSLARYTAWVALMLPTLWIAVYVYRHRHLTVAELITEPGTARALLVVLVAVATLMLRARVLRWLDRRFLADRPDHPAVLARLERRLRYARGANDVANSLRREITRTFHTRRAAVLVAAPGGAELVPLTRGTRSLKLQSGLGRLLVRSGGPIPTDEVGEQSVRRILPLDDQLWLAEHDVDLIVPLTGSDASLIGVLTLGPKRNEYPFSEDDQLLIEAMAGASAVMLENRILREAPAAGEPIAAGPPSIDWDREPAAECPTCSLIWSGPTRECTCGAQTVTAAVPRMLFGKFRVEAAIGRGGMGVVYRATDLALGRRVAIKTLPRITPEAAARLRREAKVMAAVVHPHLALIYGVETWRATPLLIVEYFEGGTLAARLAHGPLEPYDMVELGVALSDALDLMHRSAILHRDIKPTNIGFAREGVPKLLDLGLASVLESPGTAADGSPDTTSSPRGTITPLGVSGNAAVPVSRSSRRCRARRPFRSLEPQPGPLRSGDRCESVQGRHGR